MAAEVNDSFDIDHRKKNPLKYEDGSNDIEGDNNIKDNDNDEKTDDAMIKNDENIDKDFFKVPQHLGITSFGVKKSSNLIKSTLGVSLDEASSKPNDDISLEKKADQNLNPTADVKTKSSEKSKKLPFLPSEKLQQVKLSANIPYKEPAWGGFNERSNAYKLEVIKQGTVIEDVSLADKSLVIFGRLPSCDVPMDHPSISRHHAVLQYRVDMDCTHPIESEKNYMDVTEEATDSKFKKEIENNGDTKLEADNNNNNVEYSTDKPDTNGEDGNAGWYIYDLDSTHGTWVNKYKLPPRKYVRLRVDYVLKFGGSTRLFVLHGPDDDRERESELSVAEMQKLKRETEMARLLEVAAGEAKLAEMERQERLREENRGCSWGMGDDDDVTKDEDNDPEAVNPFAELTDESLYIEDPKKAIRGFYEREGLDEPEYEFLEDNTSFIGAGFKRRCRLELPIDDPNGKTLYAEVTVSGKKKDAVIACALEACRILDRHGVLRQSKHDSRAKKRRKDWAEADYYDSDDDTYLDRTGDVEKKRQHRMQKAETAKIGSRAETHESLSEKLDKVSAEIKELEEKLAKDEELKSKSVMKNNDDDGEVDALDAFMMSIKSGGLDVRTRIDLKKRLLEMRHQKNRLQALVALSKPCDIKLISNKKATTALYGKKQKFGKIVKPEYKKEFNDGGGDEEEEEEEEEDMQSEDVHPKIDIKTDIKAVTYDSDTKKTDEILNETVNKTDESTSVIVKENIPTRTKSDEIVPIKTSNTDKNVDSGEKGVKPASKNKMKSSSSSSSSSSTSLSVPSVAKKLKEDMNRLPPLEGPEYSTWLPPTDQSGDGRTKLNEKYGY